MSKALSPQAPARTSISLEIWGYFALAALWAYAIIKPAMMWDWLYYHDTPLLNYAALLMHDFGQIPYRDMFETTMPGTFLFHYIIVGLGLETQTAFVTLGILAMFALAGAGCLILWRIDRWAGLLFAPFYLMVMFQFGPSALFQREILGLLAMSSALIIATRTGAIPYMWRQGLVGLLFGIACTVKPQFALGAPVAVLCLAALARDKGTTQSALRTVITGILASVAGFALPLGVTFWWLWSYGALEDFWFILTQYTPLYIQQTQSHGFIPAELRPLYIGLLWFRFAGFWTLLPGVALLLVVIVGYHTRIARPNLILLRSIIALVAVYGLVPILSGQFWGYHYYPFIFFAILAVSALLSVALGPILSRSGQIACLALVAFSIAHNRAKVYGLDVSYDFPELDRLRDSQYMRVEQNKLYDIYLRRDLAS